MQIDGDWYTNKQQILTLIRRLILTMVQVSYQLVMHLPPLQVNIMDRDFGLMICILTEIHQMKLVYLVMSTTLKLLMLNYMMPALLEVQELALW